MQRIIYIDVTANRARVSSLSLGTQGEHAVTHLSFSFDDSWDGLTKRLLWRTADGAQSAFTLLSAPDSFGRYSAAVPALPLSVEGYCSLTVEGFAVNGTELTRRARSIQLLFSVEPNDSEASEQAAALDASLAEQLQAGIDSLGESLRAEIAEQADSFNEALDGKAAASHGHNASQIVCTGIDGLPNLLQGTINDISEAISNKSDAGHTHSFSASDISYNGSSDLGEAVSSLSSRREVRCYRFTFAADNWSGTSAPYSRSLSLSSATPDSAAFISLAPEGSDAAFRALSAAEIRTVPSNGAITVKAYGVKPSISIPVILTIVI